MRVVCCAVASGGPWFNLFNLGGKSEAEMKKLKLNEIKNGRLAMLAVFGYGAQVRADGMTGTTCISIVVYFSLAVQASLVARSMAAALCLVMAVAARLTASQRSRCVLHLLAAVACYTDSAVLGMGD
jgi:hypothetical protein